MGLALRLRSYGFQATSFLVLEIAGSPTVSLYSFEVCPKKWHKKPLEALLATSARKSQWWCFLAEVAFYAMKIRFFSVRIT